MFRLGTIVLLALVAIWGIGCGSRAQRSISPTQSKNNGNAGAANNADAPVISSISPACD